MRRVLLSAAALALVPLSPATSHPHVFVGVEVTVVYAGDTAQAVRLNWIYDDYFSLLITSDLGIDLDGDMVLTPQEEVKLAEAVTAWPPDFQGDLEVMQDGTLVDLAPKKDHRMILKDGIVHEIHTRPLAPHADGPLTIRVYDPFYFVAYELAGPVLIEGRADCDTTITPPDLDRAYSLVEELLYGRPASDVGPDEEFPEVGVEFAETIVVTCAG